MLAHAPAGSCSVFAEFGYDDEAGLEATIERVLAQVAAAGGDEAAGLAGIDDQVLRDIRVFRHAVPERINATIARRREQHPTLHKIATDMAVEDRDLRWVYDLYTTRLTAAALDHAVFGHAGNNHFHVNILPKDDGELQRAKAIYAEFAAAIVARGGCVSAEHGIGRIKKHFLPVQYEAGTLAAMRAAKRWLDPELAAQSGRAGRSRVASRSARVRTKLRRMCRNDARLLTLFALAAVVLVDRPLLAQTAATPSGEAVYQRRCAACHDQVSDRIPPKASLNQMPSTRILRALDFGAMMTVAYPMSRAERQAVAVLPRDRLSRRSTFRRAPTAAAGGRRCPTRRRSSWNGWSPTASNARYQGAAAAGLSADTARNLKLKWAFGFDGDVTAFAQPTVIDGQIFVGSAGGVIHALRADTGCLQWTYQADGPVRMSIVAAPMGSTHALLFGDQTGWFYALDAETGTLIWKKQIEAHDAARLTGSPVVVQRQRVRAGRLVGRDAGARSHVSLLHLPGQRRRAADPRRRAGVEGPPGG